MRRHPEWNRRLCSIVAYVTTGLFWASVIGQAIP